MIANPVVVISFLGVFAVLEIDVHPTGLLGAAQVGAGLFAGSSAWWVVYSLADWIAGAQLRQCGLRAINLGGGLLICGFGLWHLGVAFIHRH
jgi:threonine/homoserine/homoserine lactone efflux protein